MKKKGGDQHRAENKSQLGKRVVGKGRAGPQGAIPGGQVGVRRHRKITKARELIFSGNAGSESQNR